MEVSDILQNGGLILSGAAVAKLAEAAVKAWSARNQKTELSPSPLPVKDETPRYVSCAECDRRHAEIDRRMAQSDADTRDILAKLDDLKRDNESYARRIHDRLDPVVQAVAANQELLKQHLEDHRSKP